MPEKHMGTAYWFVITTEVNYFAWLNQPKSTRNTCT